MLDLKLTGGMVADGTGAPLQRADVGVRDGRVVALGRVDEPARRTLDASDLVVAPGFIDVHTHYDAQAFWDSTLSPSPLHGVTTVVGGNCGFSIAPLSPEDGDYLMRMLARVEGMPLEALQQGVPWDWSTTAEYLDRLDGTLTPNAGFLVGHSAVRRAVMHDDAVGHAANPGQLAAMQQLLHDGLAAGGLGFSSTWSRSHNDHNGDPVPSRHATREEMLALCSVVGEHPGTTLEFIPGVAPFDDDLFELMGVMSRTADRPINWNVLQVYGRNADAVDRQLAGSDLAAEGGGRVVALTLPDTLRLWLNFKSGFILDILNGWERLMALPDARKLAELSDPTGRAEMDRLAQETDGPSRSIAHWAAYRVEESSVPGAKGRMVGELATEQRRAAWDVLADLVVADELRTVISKPDPGQDEASWEKRVSVWRDPRSLVGASDAGAHLDMIDSFSYATTLIARTVRERNLLAIEEAVQLLTDAPARLYGLRDRGRVAVGAHADLVVLDPATVGPGPIHTRYDLPGGAGRIYGGAEGVANVFVAGAEVVAHGEFTDARPGRVLRSGRDTETVSVGTPG
ncbi:MAG: amidohydrolase family protein [Acidimicrobiales bacterium]|jgi:N-acyl-D-aspartate/D-glutamate deacylase